MPNKEKKRVLEVQTADQLRLVEEGGQTLWATRNRTAKATRFSVGSAPDVDFAVVVSDAAVRAFAKGLVRLVGKED